MDTGLIAQLQHLVLRTPLELIERVCKQLDTSTNWEQAVTRIAPILPTGELRELLVRACQAASLQSYLPRDVSLALRTAVSIEDHHHTVQRLELVWTGPTVQSSTLRRTDEALLQLISGAQDTLTLVSFAVYRVERLAKALGDAVQRGVSAKLFFEIDHADFAQELVANTDFSKMQIYTWSDSRRPRSVQNKLAVLHAKAAIADGSSLFISSANLTENAMSLNIELGIMIVGGDLPRKVDRLYTDLLERGVFVIAT